MASMGPNIVVTLIDLVTGPLGRIKAGMLGLSKTAAAANATMAKTAAATGASVAAAAVPPAALAGLTRQQQAIAALQKMAPAAGLLGLGAYGTLFSLRHIDDAKSFDTAMTGVRKVMNLTREEMERMKTVVLDLSTTMPVRAEDIAESFRFGARLSHDVDFLKTFATTVAKTQTSFDMTAEQASETIKNMLNIYHIPATGEGMVYLEELLDSVNALDNKFKGATAKNIMEFIKRASANAKVAGMGAKDVAAIGAVYESVGLKAEQTARVWSNALTVAQSAGAAGDKARALITGKDGTGLGYNSAKEFAEGFEKNGIYFMKDILTRLSKLKSPAKRQEILRGIFQMFQGREINRLVDAIDGFNEAVSLSNDRLKTLNSLADETTAAWDAWEQRAAIADNAWRALGIKMANPYAKVGAAISDISAKIAQSLNWMTSHIGSKGTEIFSVFMGVASAIGVAKVAFSLWQGASLAGAIASATMLGLKFGVIGAAVYAILTNWDSITAAIGQAVGYGQQFLQIWTDKGLLEALGKIKDDMMAIANVDMKNQTEGKWSDWTLWRKLQELGLPIPDPGGGPKEEEKDPLAVPEKIPDTVLGGGNATAWDKFIGRKGATDWSAIPKVPEGEPAMVPEGKKKSQKGKLKEVPGVYVVPGDQGAIQPPPPETEPPPPPPPQNTYNPRAPQYGAPTAPTPAAPSPPQVSFQPGGQTMIDIEVPPPQVTITGKKAPYVKITVDVSEAGLIQAVGKAASQGGLNPGLTDGVN